MRCSRRLIPTSVVAVAVVSLLAAGCGGGLSAVHDRLHDDADRSARLRPLHPLPRIVELARFAAVLVDSQTRSNAWLVVQGASD